MEVEKKDNAYWMKMDSSTGKATSKFSGNLSSTYHLAALPYTLSPLLHHSHNWINWTFARIIAPGIWDMQGWIVQEWGKQATDKLWKGQTQFQDLLVKIFPAEIAHVLRIVCNMMLHANLACTFQNGDVKISLELCQNHQRNMEYFMKRGCKRPRKWRLKQNVSSL